MWVSRFVTFFKPERSATVDDCLELTPAQLDRFGFWLDFDPAVEAQYEADTGTDRVARMHWATYSGPTTIRPLAARGLSTKIHMAVRGLGCPVRFVLMPGQKGDVPQVLRR